MKLVTFSLNTPLGAVERVGALRAGSVVDLSAVYAWWLHRRGVGAATALAESIIPPDMAEFLSRWPMSREAAETALSFADDLDHEAVSSFGARAIYRVSEYRLCTPLRPRRLKDYLVYEAHKKQAMAARGLEMPELWYQMPTYTNRNHCGLADPGQDIVWPSYSQRLDFEFELALVIARAGRDIAAADAMDYVAGITIYNDFSARDIQADEGRIGAGPGKSKDFDYGNVLGPCIVTLDEINPHDITMILRVDGREWSRGHTSGMKFSWPQIVENASRGETIFPGDVFASGTMDGGCCLELDRTLEPGMVIEMEAVGIGILRNRIISAPRNER
ncbi:fumarylacetoacetate hydrolase family protein [Pseudorhodoplanes sp.]|uniref:fumarylacetoacetate hydrolase family protein n=1 Tax=Pseudorhodoplanes sp. TaxID=1934341 RepID=UPI002CC734DE|nr:fumarylacetoacetate hydrolase family protein [Pseudorhodoplanes sp.]HWV54631.1 fumarylacetoacetate hydrolase family protein [Pseudorhodoplanes sp.]